jgi:hypothetical protein
MLLEVLNIQEAGECRFLLGFHGIHIKNGATGAFFIIELPARMPAGLIFFGKRLL